MPVSNAQFSPENKIVLSKILERIHTSDDIVSYEDRYWEFDGCRHQVNSGKDGSFQISFALPKLDPQYRDSMLNEKAYRQVAEVYSNIATLIEPRDDHDVTLDVDMATLSRLNTSDQEYWAKQLASVRLMIAGFPLRQVFSALSDGTLASGPTQAHCQKAGQVYFVKPDADKVTLIFPMRFVTSQDAVVGTAVLQEFAEARRAPALGLSPTCSYLPPKSLPLELKDVPEELVGDANGGYVSFGLFQRHVTGPQLEHVMWSFSTFYHLISYHITCCKVTMHTRMRSRVDGMLKALNMRQVSVGPGALLGGVDASKRTITGRFFTPGETALQGTSPLSLLLKEAALRKMTTE